MKKAVLLDLAIEASQRQGRLPTDFANKMAKRIKRKFSIAVEPQKISEIASHYAEIYICAASILKKHVKLSPSGYAELGNIDDKRFMDALSKKFPDDSSDILDGIASLVIQYEYLR